MLRVIGVVADKSGRRMLHTARPLQAAAGTAAAPTKDAETATSVVDPSNPTIAPTYVPWKEYKNEYYRKRGYTVAPKDWTEWSDLPAPYKYMGVKVDPAHVEKPGFLWKFMSDWKTGVPMVLFLAMPFYGSGLLPGFDERLQLGLIITMAGTVMAKEVAPMFRNFKAAAIKAKVQGLYDAEKGLNDEISRAVDVFSAGLSIPETIKTVNAAERALRKLEADALTRKVAIAQRDEIVSQLDYLVSLKGSAAGESGAAVLKNARAAVESALEKDAAVQQKSIEAAIKALSSGTTTEDIVTPLFNKAVEAAETAANANKAATNPFTSPQQVEMFKKRFGYGDDVVTESTLARAKVDKSVNASITGKIGGKVPAVGAKFVLKAPIAYAK